MNIRERDDKEGSEKDEKRFLLGLNEGMDAKCWECRAKFAGRLMAIRRDRWRALKGKENSCLNIVYGKLSV